MGYRSSMNINCAIKIKKEDLPDFKILICDKGSESWLNIAAKHKINNSAKCYANYLQYDIEVDDDCEEGFVIVEFDEDSERKNYETEMLARIIAKFAQNKDPIEIMFQGEDGEEWGYRIKDGKLIYLEEVKTFKETEIEL